MKINGSVVKSMRLVAASDSIPGTPFSGLLSFDSERFKDIEMNYSEGNGVVIKYRTVSFLIPLHNIKSLVFE